MVSMESKAYGGVAFVCDLRGLVQRVIYDGLGLALHANGKTSFLELADNANREKAKHFHETLQFQGVAFDWEINVLVDDELASLHWAGCSSKDSLVVILARTPTDLLLLINELRRGNYEFNEAVQVLAAETFRLFEEHGAHDARVFDELTRVNNELAALHRTLAKQNAELEQLGELKSRFLAMAAHDLRKPAGVILTYTEFVLDEADISLSEEQKKYLQTCLNAAAGMKHIIDGFLDMAVIESGMLHLDVAPVSVAQIIEGVVEICRLQAAIKKVHLLVDPAEGTRRFQADAPKLQQVLLNLLYNAVEHSPEGRHVWLSSCWAQDELVFSVRDEGAGLTPEVQTQLFIPFVNAGTRKTAGERTMGLGLQIAKIIVEAHKGRLWVESEPGKGTTFFVSVPADSEYLVEYDPG
jgi:signal transduction histidine kinase